MKLSRHEVDLCRTRACSEPLGRDLRASGSWNPAYDGDDWSDLDSHRASHIPGRSGARLCGGEGAPTNAAILERDAQVDCIVPRRAVWKWRCRFGVLQRPPAVVGARDDSVPPRVGGTPSVLPEDPACT